MTASTFSKVASNTSPPQRRRLLKATRTLLRGHWPYFYLAMLLYLLTGVFAGNTLAIVILAIDSVIADSASQISNNFGPLAPIIDTWRTSLGTDGFFLLLVTLAVASQIVRSLLEFGAGASAVSLRARVEASIKECLFENLIQRNYENLSQFKSGYLISQFNYANRAGVFTYYVAELVGLSLITLVYLSLLMWLANLSTLFLLGIVVLVGIGLLRVIRWVRLAGQGDLNARIGLNEQILELIEGLYIVRVFAREQHTRQRVHELVTVGRDHLIRGQTWQSFIRPITQISSILIVATLLFVSYLSSQASGSEQALTQVLAFIFVLWQTTPYLGGLSVHYANLMKEWYAVNLIYQMVYEETTLYESQTGETFPGLRREVCFEEVTYAYVSGGQPVLHEMSFCLERGQMLALVGQSGSGKSTALDLLLRLYQPQSGRISVDGVDLERYNVQSWRERIGVVNQDAMLFNQSIADNIRFGRLDATQDDIEAAARAANAHDFIMTLPQGYETVVGNRGDALSGGQRQRIALARALVRNVDVLILDEATSNLDSESEALIQQSLMRLRGKVTLLVVAHRLSTVNQADQILVLKEGQIIERGTHEQLIQQGGDYARFWHLQASSEGSE